jgi:mannose-1-phosphate guanylyltransferase
MASSLRQAADLAGSDSGTIFLLGMEPSAPDTELGYILPASRSPAGIMNVLRFIEKPNDIRARVLLDQGALWNVFIMAASVRVLLGLFDARFTATIAAMRGFDSAGLDSVYRDLTSMDFSREVLQGKESLMKVLTVPRCGWTDLGTPERVGLILEQLKASELASHPYFPAHVSLADQYMRVHLDRGRPRSVSRTNASPSV